MADGKTTTIKDLARLVEQDRSYSHMRSTYFREMVETWTLALRNAVEPRDQAWSAREARFEEIKAKYGPETMEVFSRILAQLFLMASVRMGDHLGELNMELELGVKGSGQFFTPYHVSRMMAAMAHDAAIEEAIARQGWVSLNEPACGSGGMVVAFAEQMRDAGHDYTRQLRVVAQDIDLHCVNMCYVQMRLHGIPAAVVHGDTLRNEQRSAILTPAYVMQGAAAA